LSKAKGSLAPDDITAMRIPLIAAAAISAVLTVWCGHAATAQSPSMAEEREVRAICGTACHAYPPSDILPRSAWPDTVARMTLFRDGLSEPFVARGTLAGKVVLPEDMERVLAFYLWNAPARLPPPDPWPSPDAKNPVFRKRAMAPGNLKGAPGISNVRFLDLDGDGTVQVVATDMRHGLVLRGNPKDLRGDLTVIAKVPHPGHTELVDVDGDGLRDLLIADLGQFLPGDDEKGAAVWLRRLKSGEYEPHTFGGFPRVADVRAADFDRDGKLDLLVGAFGWRKVGHIALLKNQGPDAATPDFSVRTRIDERSGTVNVYPTDLNGDGRIDFIALISQQYEQVVAFLNQPAGFTPQVIYAGPHPNWGSSGMDVADIDGDGDLDVLLAHGDTLDDGIVKPYHGIEWLENRGTYPFTAHTLTTLAGVHPVKAVDFDRDGDLDVVAGAFYPPDAIGATPKLPSVVWLEQVAPGRFERHSLELGSPLHASLDAADFDGDGDIDLAIGNLSAEHEMPVWVEIWENQAVAK
jgi:hypothetical protein